MSTKSVLDLYLNVLPSYKRAANGWLNFNCPACGDQRDRGSFLVTPSGGFRYHCFNGGCDYNTQPTGWEPEGGLGGRPRKLYTLLGGQIRDLPLDAIFKQETKFNRKGVAQGGDEASAVYYFERMELPADSVNLLDPGDYLENPKYIQVLDYICGRSETFLSLHEFYWSPEFPTFLIVPYIHNGTIVGYLARNTVKDSKTRMFQKCHPDYLFNQHILSQDNQWVTLSEGVIDGIALSGVSSRGTALTPKQELLLNLSGKEIIVIPDQQPDGVSLVDYAEKNDWWVASPVWDRDIKDAAKALNSYGMLYTIESVIASAHKNYLKAKTSIRLK